MTMKFDCFCLIFSTYLYLELYFVSVATVGVTELSSPLSESDLQATVGIAVTQGVLQSGLLARVLVSTVNGTAQGLDAIHVHVQ